MGWFEDIFAGPRTVNTQQTRGINMANPAAFNTAMNAATNSLQNQSRVNLAPQIRAGADTLGGFFNRANSNTLSPDTRAAIDSSLAIGKRQLQEQILPGLQQQFVAGGGAGAYGDSRYDLAVRNALSDYSRNAGETATLLGLQQLNNDRTQGIAALNSVPALVTADRTNNLGGIDLPRLVGDMAATPLGTTTNESRTEEGNLAQGLLGALLAMGALGRGGGSGTGTGGLGGLFDSITGGLGDLVNGVTGGLGDILDWFSGDSGLGGLLNQFGEFNLNDTIGNFDTTADGVENITDGMFENSGEFDLPPLPPPINPATFNTGDTINPFQGFDLTDPRSVLDLTSSLFNDLGINIPGLTFNVGDVVGDFAFPDVLNLGNGTGTGTGTGSGQFNVGENNEFDFGDGTQQQPTQTQQPQPTTTSVQTGTARNTVQNTAEFTGNGGGSALNPASLADAVLNPIADTVINGITNGLPGATINVGDAAGAFDFPATLGDGGVINNGQWFSGNTPPPEAFELPSAPRVPRAPGQAPQVQSPNAGTPPTNDSLSTVTLQSGNATNTVDQTAEFTGSGGGSTFNLNGFNPATIADLTGSVLNPITGGLPGVTFNAGAAPGAFEGFTSTLTDDILGLGAGSAGQGGAAGGAGLGDLFNSVSEPVGNLFNTITQPVRDLLAPITNPINEALAPVGGLSTVMAAAAPALAYLGATMQSRGERTTANELADSISAGIESAMQNGLSVHRAEVGGRTWDFKVTERGHSRDGRFFQLADGNWLGINADPGATPLGPISNADFREWQSLRDDPAWVAYFDQNGRLVKREATAMEQVSTPERTADPAAAEIEWNRLRNESGNGGGGGDR